MFGLIVGCVAVTLLADAALNPDNRRALRARLRRRRVAQLRAQQAERVADDSGERAHARKMRTIAKARLPYLRATLLDVQKSHQHSVAHRLDAIAEREAKQIEKLLAEITSLEPWLDP